MKVRHKLLVGIAVIVMFMAGVSFSISQGYLGNLFRQYAAAARQGNAEQWGRLLAYYYEAHGTWAGVGMYVWGIFGSNSGGASQPEYLALYDNQGHQVVAVGQTQTAPPDPIGEVRVPLQLNGQTIGTMQIYDRGLEGLNRIEQSVLRSMMVATVWGSVVTAVLALAMAAWFARRFTRPLQTVMDGIQRITQGDLNAQVEIPSKDEFGEVGQAFNNMAVQLARTEEARRHLVADVAHELRIPLTIIRGQLELVQQGVKSADPETLLPIQDEATRLTRLVNDLHQLTLAEVGKLPLEKQPTDIAGLVQRVVDNFEVDSEDKQVAVSLENHAGEVVCEVDPNRMTQVFVNLLGNALRYTPAGGKVTVKVQRNAQWLTVSVSDTGPGIAAKHLDHVFDRFYRADVDRSRQTGGTGLGLAIAKEFVEAHGGLIGVQSEPGQGTTFSVHLLVCD